MTVEGAGRPAVLLGGESAALSAARSLGRAGVQVHVAGDEVWDTVGRSRYCASFTHVDTGEGLEERWLAWLERGPRGAAIMPTSDEALLLVARHRARLIELGYVPFDADDEVLLAMLDKRRTYALAREAGVAAPETTALSSPEEIDGALERVRFPCALKPAHSHLFSRHFGIRKKLFVVESRAELEWVVEQTSPLGLEMLLTEIIPGADDRIAIYTSYIDTDGTPLFHFTRRKLRQYPPRFGIGCYQLTEWVPDVADAGLRFLQSVGVRGLASVEFKRDPRDGHVKLMECNHRFTTGTEITRLAGIDIALFTYNRLAGLSPPPVSSFRDGIRMWNPVEDARSFLISRRRGELSLGEWLRSLLHPQRFPVFSWSDPRPALANYTRLLGRGRSRGR